MPGEVRPPSLDMLPPLPHYTQPSYPPFPRLHIRDVAVFGALMAVFALALKPVVDNDLFWHLATGRYIWATGHIPLVDPFSWTVPGRRWIAHEWLTELWLYPVYTHGGYGALMLAFAAIIAAAFALTYGTARRLGASRPWAVAITLLAAVACAHTWGVRPQMVSMAFMALTLRLLMPGPKGTMAGARSDGRLGAIHGRIPAVILHGQAPINVPTTIVWRTLSLLRALPALWLLVPLMAVWANMHGGFIFGLALIGAFAAGESGRAIWAALYDDADATYARAIRLWQVLVLSTAACLLTPNGLSGLIYPFSYLGDNASTRYISEWVSPDFHKFQYHFFEALLLALIVGLAGLARRPAVVPGLRRVPYLTQALLLVAFTHLALDSVRNINLFSVIVAPFIAAYLSGSWRNLAEVMSRTASPRRSTIAAPPVPPIRAALNLGLAAFIVAAVLIARAPDLTYARNAAAQARIFPSHAVSYIRSHRIPGPLLNSYDWGGYLIWTLFPRLRVYVDGRPDMYGDRFMDDFIHTWQAQPGWQKTLRERGVRTILVEPSSGLAHALSATPGWRLIYHDSVAVLYERAT
jgi:hypothetical protein